jgi:hypothetical protein
MSNTKDTKNAAAKGKNKSKMNISQNLNATFNDMGEGDDVNDRLKENISENAHNHGAGADQESSQSDEDIFAQIGK